VRAVVLQDPPSFPPGTIVAVDRKAIWVSCADGVVGIEKLHPAGKTAMATADYLNGHRVKVGESLG
jgi:methionyl-tRNA formyltransferase